MANKRNQKKRLSDPSYSTATGVRLDNNGTPMVDELGNPRSSIRHSSTPVEVFSLKSAREKYDGKLSRTGYPTRY